MIASQPPGGFVRRLSRTIDDPTEQHKRGVGGKLVFFQDWLRSMDDFETMWRLCPTLPLMR